MVIELKSETAASVWRINVEVDVAVEKNDEVCILESMKMEIPVVAPISGTVTEILVKEGDFVEEGQLLLTMQT